MQLRETAAIDVVLVGAKGGVGWNEGHSIDARCPQGRLLDTMDTNRCPPATSGCFAGGLLYSGIRALAYKRGCPPFRELDPATTASPRF